LAKERSTSEPLAKERGANSVSLVLLSPVIRDSDLHRYGGPEPKTSFIPSSMFSSSHLLPPSTCSESISKTTSSWTRFTTFGSPGHPLRLSHRRAAAYLNPSPALPWMGVLSRREGFARQDPW